MLVPLSDLHESEKGIIASIKTTSRTDVNSHHHLHHQHRRFERRLMDMELTPGTPITVVKSAPFRGPIEVLLRGSRLARA